MINPFRRNTITISRPNVDATKGDAGYIAETPADETVIVSGLAADIQHKAQTTAVGTKLPGDVNRGTYYEIFFNHAQNTIKDRDIITDEQGIRYQITSAYWTVFQYQCICERLQN